MSKIQILYWSDFICPYCYIAEKRMKNLMKELNIMDKFEFKLLSFELDPNAPKERKLNILDKFEFKLLSFELDPNAPKQRNLNVSQILAKKYNTTTEKANQTVEYINQLGKAEGIDFKYDKCLGGNTFNAHRLVKYIENKKNYENTEKIINLLYDAYFYKNLLISNEKILIELGMKVGESKEDIENFIKQ